ncbi:alpha/beta hydrolase-fold protein [Polaribacter sp.]|uniref:alpha/beta hydrolase-fold protein n=1 Tax=Polaribacter sp. TaxID=1920175 RepID=UPI00404776D3
MKVFTPILFFLFVFNAKISHCQNFNLYSNDSLSINTSFLNEPIQLRIHFPETFHFSSSNTKYPITIVFDSQHERTYPHIIHSFDLLTSESQIPESIIIGVPFTMHNRLYFTSNQKKQGDSLSGIERMERFLFSELIPKFQKEYKANEFITLIGHSRTAFLVNYLSANPSNKVSIGIALSGFFEEDTLSINTFQEFLSESSNFPKKFSYYFTAGTTSEEENYLKQYRQLNSYLQTITLPKNVKTFFRETPNANHISNFWVSIPTILMDAYAPYNSILNLWFDQKLKKETIPNPVDEFKKDLENVNEELGVKLNPNITQLFSLSSDYAYDKKDFKTALDFMQLAISYYPDYLDFYVDMIEYFKSMKDVKKVKEYQKILKEKTLNATYFGEYSKEDILKFLEEK